MKFLAERCSGCGICVQDCPLGAIRLKRKKVSFDRGCAHCGTCIRVCPEGAIALEEPEATQGLRCDCCPIGCLIKEGYMGACHRYRNRDGTLERTTPLHRFDDVKEIVGPEPREEIRRPLITGIGAGTTYPDCRPAPSIVRGRREGVDVVTVVTEAPLSYSSVMVKIDTDMPIGREGDEVLAGRRKVGMVQTEQYGSKILSIGGVNLLTAEDGVPAARLISEIANRKPVRLKIRSGSRLRIRVGSAPVIDGQEVARMRVGCGSATMGLFAPVFKEAADEVIVLDSHLTALLSEHPAGRFIGIRPSGIRLRFRQSTPGRYFGDHGKGWGGTSVLNPAEAISGIDAAVARPGMKILITETTGQKAAMYRLSGSGELEEIPLSEKASQAVGVIAASCEPSRVSAVYIGGAGGSGRAGVCRYPVKLTQAVHSGKAILTVGGAPTFILPGGGITFMVDVERVKPGAFYWTPTPATICPIEYTMESKDYEEMGGHIEAMKPFEARKPLSRPKQA